MDGFLLLTFASLAALTAVLELFKRRTSKLDTTNREFLRFRANYMLVYALMMGGTPCAYTHLCFTMTTEISSIYTCKVPFCSAMHTSCLAEV